MYHFIVKYIIKDQGEKPSPLLRPVYGNVASLVGIIVNLLLFIGKFTAGSLIGSVAVVGDAINNLSDAGSSIVSFVSFRLSKKPADRSHPFGHARVEYVAASLVASIVLFIGFSLFRSSIDKILHPEPVRFTTFTLILLVVSILVKFWLFRFYKKIAKRIDSSVLQSAALDSISDVLATSGVLISGLLSPIVGIELDGYMGLLVSIIIMISGIRALKETLDQILGQGPSEESVEEISTFIKEYNGVLGLHDLVVHDYGPGRRFASVHVEVDAKAPLMTSHELIDKIERDVLQQLHIHLVIHLDPLLLDDPWVNQMRKLTEGVVSAQNQDLSIHDFRVVKGQSYSNLIFDILVPYSCKISDNQIVEEINQQLKAQDATLRAIITIDRTYTPEVHKP